MVSIKFSKEVEGTIVSPITVMLHHCAQYEGFIIQANTDNGTRTLTLVNRNPVHSITYPMTLRNGLWFHKYSSVFAPKPTIKRLNNACISNKCHGCLAQVGNDVMDNIHKHVIGIDRPLKRNTFNKCGSCLLNKMNKQPHKRNTK